MNSKLYDLMDWMEIETIVYSEHDHPEKVLGPHKVRGGVLVQSFLPDAKTAFIKTKKEGKIYPMEVADEAGFFATLLPSRKIQAYTLIAKYADGEEYEYEDSYLYGSLLQQKDLEAFDQGLSYDAYRFMGAHPVRIDFTGKEEKITWDVNVEESKPDVIYGTHFAVWAPNAERVSVVGDFNQWDGRRHQMIKADAYGVFSLFIPNVKCGELYKYEIKINDRTIVLKSDPYGFASELRPANANKVTNLKNYKWQDWKWMEARKEMKWETSPLSIYEVHLGSWNNELTEKSDDCPFENYRTMAPAIADYVQEMGYTHIELLPVMEHPLDQSWGYQTTGYYAATARYGTPQDLMYFIDYMHQQGIGVILDWVPGHFPKDEHGLVRFDGTCLYEHLDPRQGEQPTWGTLIYNYARPQVFEFLASSAMFWKDIFHADGIRVGAVASMLYLDYGKSNGEWISNSMGGRENLDAIAFLKKVSKAFHAAEDGALWLAEESASWPKVTESIEESGLGFDMKWNTAWTNDLLDYMKLDPLFRKGAHGKLTLSMIYAYSERFMLAFSHDEVARGKHSLLEKMFGSREQQFSSLRLMLGYMMAYPGKKLLFMGQDFGQPEEWSEETGLHWDLLKDKNHLQLQRYVKEWNRFYCNNPALFEKDFDVSGFEWISCMDADHSIIAFLRKGEQKKEMLLVVCNFTPVLYENFKVGVPCAGIYREVLNSDDELYGGSGCVNSCHVLSKEVSWDGRANSITIDVPPLGICVFSCIPDTVSQ